MSGTFNEIDVPPTLVSFAVDVATKQDVITPELKAAGNKLMLFTMAKDAYDLPDYEQAMKLYDTIHALIGKKAIISAYALDGKGIAAAVSKMGFGNKLGVTIDSSVSKETLFAPGFGSLVAEVPVASVDAVKEVFAAAGLESYMAVIGRVNDTRSFVYDEMTLPMDEAISVWTGTLEKVFPTVAVDDKSDVKTGLYEAKEIYVF